MVEKILQNFALGGALVATAIAVGSLVDPVFGGLIAALPVRLTATFLLSGMNSGSEEFTHKLVEGSFLTYFGTFAFLGILYFGIPKFGFMRSFVVAVIADVAIIMLLFKLTGKF